MVRTGSIAAIDPGRSKCGLVRTDPSQQQIVLACIASPADCLDLLQHWQRSGELAAVVLGNGTSCQIWQRNLSDTGLALHIVDEWGTTLAARQRYWELWPPQGWRRLLPQGLRLPPRDLDDVAAQILLERWLGQPLSRSPQTLGNEPQLRSGRAR